MRIYISSDHGGFELKQQILESGIALMTDMGPYEFKSDDDYPLYAFPLAERVAKESADTANIADTRAVTGILLCRSGNGMAIAANKVPGIRAALCLTSIQAIAAVEHNNANILVLDSDYSADQVEVVEAFLKAKFAGGRHQRRLDQITDYETKLVNSHST